MYKILIHLYNYLPKKFRRYITKKTIYRIVNKYTDLKVFGVDNIPQDEPVIFIGNHLSNLDGLILSKFFEDYNKKVYFLAGVKLKDEVLTNAVLEIVHHIEIEPNKPDRKAIKRAIGVLKDGNSLLIFPEGTRSRTGEMIRGRSGVYLIGKLAGKKIIPFGISGTEKCLPIVNEGNMSDEKFTYSKVELKFGKSFYAEEFKDLDEPIDGIMKRIAELLPIEYRGYYK